ncbi:MAG: hypothetical protein ACREBN_10565 [Burkholderiaceae bacterium]
MKTRRTHIAQPIEAPQRVSDAYVLKDIALALLALVFVILIMPAGCGGGGSAMTDYMENQLVETLFKTKPCGEGLAGRCIDLGDNAPKK